MTVQEGSKLIGAASYTVHDAIESIGFGRFQIILSILTGFAWMADSMEVMMLSLLSPALACEWGISPAEQGLFISALLCSIFGIATAASQNFPMFVVLRGCVGLAIGGVTQVATIYTEFLPTTKRATCVIMLEFFWAIGAAVEVALALVVMPTLGWRGLVVLSSLPLLMFALCCIWMPEYARFHIAHDRNDKAREVLERVARYNKSELPQGDLVAETSEDTEKDPKAMTAFSYYGMTLYTTKLFQSTDVCHGGSVENAYTNNTSTCKPLTQEDYVDIIATAFSEVPGLILTLLLIDRLGRKLTMSVQFLFFGIANYLLYFCMKRSMIVAILFVVRALIAGAFQAAYVYTPEVYPTPMRAMGIGMASASARLGAMVTPYVAQVVAHYNLVYATLIYGTSGLIGALASFLLPIETKGRQMIDTH